MEELELLKKDWNKESDDFKEYSEKEIYTMIRYQSVSITKTLLLIGILEVILWTLYGYLNKQFLFERVGMFLVFTGIIIILFRKMKTAQDSIGLMKNILNLRTLILGYAGLSLFLAAIDGIIHFDHNTRDFMAGFTDGWNTRHHMNAAPADPGQLHPVIGNYIVFGIFLVIGLSLLYLIYKKTYGKILHDLRKNYKELKSQEEN
ncbi:hypothetical protein LF887_19175 [Chryseobacterium sp. MEBOG06]|uniref:hypothetical protein n=1 Tax=unclassified Chryseobacterium TaxID=2593645 RepID=UPI001F2F21C7|nr:MULTISPECIES: hypothetical protein [unclassified Chryseobacterium]UKB83114.1 hypothetical protein LF887_19175 [Chryseobacterium sp. MEBOG06]